jgi:hypothetical protein
MTSGIRKRWLEILLTAPLLLPLPLLPLSASCAELEWPALLARLNQPLPATVDFTEVRFSALLSKPLISSGQMIYKGANDMERHVTQPYREDTAINGESVAVQREGKPTRKFSLDRAPELRSLLTSIAALIAGDGAALSKDFTANVTGNETAWSLELTPVDPRVRKRLTTIKIQVQRDTPRCLVMQSANGSSNVMLLGALTLPETVTPATLEQRCNSVDPS